MIQEQEAEFQEVKFNQVGIRPAHPYRLSHIYVLSTLMLSFTEENPRIRWGICVCGGGVKELALETHLEGQRQGLNSGLLPSRSQLT